MAWGEKSGNIIVSGTSNNEEKTQPQGRIEREYKDSGELEKHVKKLEAVVASTEKMISQLGLPQSINNSLAGFSSIKEEMPKILQGIADAIKAFKDAKGSYDSSIDKNAAQCEQIIACVANLGNAIDKLNNLDSTVANVFNALDKAHNQLLKTDEHVQSGIEQTRQDVQEGMLQMQKQVQQTNAHMQQGVDEVQHGVKQAIEQVQAAKQELFVSSKDDFDKQMKNVESMTGAINRILQTLEAQLKKIADAQSEIAGYKDNFAQVQKSIDGTTTKLKDISNDVYYKFNSALTSFGEAKDNLDSSSGKMNQTAVKLEQDIKDFNKNSDSLQKACSSMVEAKKEVDEAVNILLNAAEKVDVQLSTLEKNNELFSSATNQLFDFQRSLRNEQRSTIAERKFIFIFLLFNLLSMSVFVLAGRNSLALLLLNEQANPYYTTATIVSICSFVVSTSFLLAIGRTFRFTDGQKGLFWIMSVLVCLASAASLVLLILA